MVEIPLEAVGADHTARGTSPTATNAGTPSTMTTRKSSKRQRANDGRRRLQHPWHHAVPQLLMATPLPFGLSPLFAPCLFTALGEQLADETYARWDLARKPRAEDREHQPFSKRCSLMGEASSNQTPPIPRRVIHAKNLHFWLNDAIDDDVWDAGHH